MKSRGGAAAGVVIWILAAITAITAQYLVPAATEHSASQRRGQTHAVLVSVHRDYTAPYSFGAIAFDPIPGTPAPIPSGQQPAYPLWADGEWPGATPPPCANDASAPPEIFADDPETWNSSTWGSGVSEVNLETGALGPPIGAGLVFFYFLNKLGATAHLDLGASGPANSTFLYAAGVQISSKTPYTLDGARASEVFLQAYTSGSTSGFSTGHAGVTPTAFKTYSVPAGDLITGELDVVDVANALDFYIYADDTATPSPYDPSAPVAGDGESRRGFFPGAHFTIEHGISDIVEDNGGGFSFWDIARPTPSPGGSPLPNSVDVCQTPLPGRDPIKNGAARTLDANYGVPIMIYGEPYPVGEYWFVDPRGNDPNLKFATAMYVSNMVDPHTLASVPPAVYELPTTWPGASPQPSTVPTPAGESISVGFNEPAVSRSIVWVESGGNGVPVRFWYFVPSF
jgi:hypothetical protein